MSKKENMSSTMKIMNQMCENLHIDMEKVIDISTAVLEMYRYSAWSEYEQSIRRDLVEDIGNGSSEMAWLWLDTFATSYEKRTYRSCIKDLTSARLIKDITMAALGFVESFPLNGIAYKKILEESYLKDNKESQELIAEKLDFPVSTFRRKKKEAIVLFGIALCNDKNIMQGVTKLAGVN